VVASYVVDSRRAVGSNLENTGENMNDWRGLSKREWMERAVTAEAKLALADTFAQWKRNAPKGSLTFEEWLKGREAAVLDTLTVPGGTE
jgi:hypothetical protein